MDGINSSGERCTEEKKEDPFITSESNKKFLEDVAAGLNPPELTEGDFTDVKNAPKPPQSVQMHEGQVMIVEILVLSLPFTIHLVHSSYIAFAPHIVL